MVKEKETKDLPDCCKPKRLSQARSDSSKCCQAKEYKGSNPLMGIAYGLIPHIGCILFIIAAILSATVLMQFFKPLLMNRYIFHYLILISIGFAALSSFLYLKKNKLLHKEGIKSKKGYLSIMFGSTVGINLILFIFIFPFLANFTGASIDDTTGLDLLQIKVDIPCPGHAPLISSEVQTIEGVKGSEYSFPNKFAVYYDASQTSEQEILSIEVFEEYPATVLTGDINQEVGPLASSLESSVGSCSGGCGGTGSCGGGCGSPSCDYNK